MEIKLGGYCGILNLRGEENRYKLALPFHNVIGHKPKPAVFFPIRASSNRRLKYLNQQPKAM